MNLNIKQLKQQSKIHFIGVGGIGMSALAFILRQWGVKVCGSDLRENYLTEKLKNAGVEYFVGHDAKNIDKDISLVVKTSIIKNDNPEILEAQKRNILIITRAQLLALIMEEYIGITVAGTHGKTSTTGMISVLLDVAGLKPTVINGGIIHYFQSNSKIGEGKYLVAESDESDASFINLPTKIGVVTNIEAEHLEFVGYQGSFEKQKACFEKYVQQIGDDGICAICIDDIEANKIYQKLKVSKNNLLSYSINYQMIGIADLVAKNIVMDINGLTFDAVFKNGQEINQIKMPIYGKHNACNALSAIAIGKFLGLDNNQIKQGLAEFNGVKQRFTKVGEFNGVSIIDDYGHHPTEIKTTLKGARDLVGKNQQVICVVQPHKYSRVRDLFNEFCNAFFDANIVIVADIYAASQSVIAGINQDSLIAGIKKAGHSNVIKLNNENDLAGLLKPLIKSGDLVFCCGAGTITSWASKLQEQLQTL
ncbi:UDP-N-acetylmuramate--L-alanine ligase [Alphaproteobacteria bacterium]|nr:UDP-N-acetylmuramate--L-alanine ligase [Alphaproteobacteria bacterium]